MRHFAAEQWEARLDAVMHELDAYLEEKYAGAYTLHPARPRRGKTANPAQDGLFGITANFSLGLGSNVGKGYVVDIRVVTLQNVPEKVREQIEVEAMQKLKALLPKYFPETNLQIAMDGNIVKIYGDLKLGNA